VNEIGSNIWDSIKAFWVSAWDIINTPIFSLSGNDLSAGTILYIIVAFFVLSFISKRIRKLLTEVILRRAGLEAAATATIGTVTRFFILVIGSIVIIQSSGIDLSALTLLAGALGVGIGFGLQNITDNFISGIIILFEKPIKVGDRIEVGGIEGDVTSISFRATSILTNDNISIIVPNSEFISSRVINWSHNDRNIRFRMPIGVSYNEDPVQIKKILLDVADKNPHILKRPAPIVLFDGFGDSSLDFVLAVWTSTHTDKPRVLKSELYFDIFDQFKKHNIEIPFPQRDLHIRSGQIASNKQA
jgi:small-conductance mechanosensitive channel